MCKISIVVPVYNVAEYVACCIESILNQSFEDFELLLIDDGSQDQSFEICKRFEKKDARVKAFSKPNGGVSSARNYGISKAQGDYITFVDSDDYVTKDYCETLISHMTNEVGMVVLGLQKAYSDGRFVPIKHRFLAGVYSFDDIVRDVVDDGTLSGFTFHSSCAILFNLNAIKNNQLTFHENIKFNEDGLFTTEYVLQNRCSVYIDYNRYVYFYRTNLESATSCVDLFGEKFTNSMINVEEVLNNYREDFECIEIQMKRRRATIALSRLTYLAVQKTLNSKKARKILSDGDVKAGFKSLNCHTMAKDKRLLCYTVKMKQYWLISVALKIRNGRK